MTGVEMVGRKLRSRADQLGLSNEDIARMSGVSARNVSHYLLGQRWARRPEDLLKVCAVLGLTPNDLLLESAPPPLSPDELTLVQVFRSASPTIRMAIMRASRAMAGHPPVHEPLSDDEPLAAAPAPKAALAR